jgi:hypothetical protein
VVIQSWSQNGFVLACRVVISAISGQRHSSEYHPAYSWPAFDFHLIIFGLSLIIYSSVKYIMNEVERITEIQLDPRQQATAEASFRLQTETGVSQQTLMGELFLI